MPFQTCIGKEIIKEATVLPRPQATPPGKQMLSLLYTFSEQWLDLGREKNLVSCVLIIVSSSTT
jgi:hypothetical protein